MTVSGAERKIRPPYLRSNERRVPSMTPDTHQFGYSPEQRPRREDVDVRFFEEWEAKRMWRLLRRNENGPMRGAHRARGHSSRLAQLSLARLLLSRDQLRFAEHSNCHQQIIPEQSGSAIPKFKIDTSAYRLGRFKIDISAYRLRGTSPALIAYWKGKSASCKTRSYEPTITNPLPLSILKRR